MTRRLIELAKFILLFVSSVLIGCVLGGFLSVLLQAVFREGEFQLGVGLMIGASYTIFAIVPAIIFGIPAIILLRRRQATKAPASIALTVGGAVVGWLLLSVTFTTFGIWGALTGASVGLTLGLLMIPSEETESTHG